MAKQGKERQKKQKKKKKEEKKVAREENGYRSHKSSFKRNANGRFLSKLEKSSRT